MYTDAFTVFSMEGECLAPNTYRDKLKTLPDLCICLLPRENLTMFRCNSFPAFFFFLPQVEV